MSLEFWWLDQVLEWMSTEKFFRHIHRSFYSTNLVLKHSLSARPLWVSWNQASSTLWCDQSLPKDLSHYTFNDIWINSTLCKPFNIRWALPLIEYFNKYTSNGLFFASGSSYPPRIHELIGGINAFYIEAYAFVLLQNVRELFLRKRLSLTNTQYKFAPIVGARHSRYRAVYTPW